MSHVQYSCRGAAVASPDRLEASLLPQQLSPETLLTKPNAGSEPFHNGASSAGHGNYLSHSTVASLATLPCSSLRWLPSPSSLPFLSSSPCSLCPASLPKWKPKVECVTIFLKPTGSHHTQSRSQTSSQESSMYCADCIQQVMFLFYLLRQNVFIPYLIDHKVWVQLNSLVFICSCSRNRSLTHYFSQLYFAIWLQDFCPCLVCVPGCSKPGGQVSWCGVASTESREMLISFQSHEGPFYPAAGSIGSYTQPVGAFEQFWCPSHVLPCSHFMPIPLSYPRLSWPLASS